jgi:putative transposase
MSLKYCTGSHTKHRLLFHLVFLPKYRRKVLNKPIAQRLKNLFYEACKVNNWWIDELEIQPDHIHMIIQIRPNVRLSDVVKILKGGSSKVIRKEFPDLKDFLWGDNFWATGYFAESVGKVNYSTMKDYIKNQNLKHATD